MIWHTNSLLDGETGDVGDDCPIVGDWFTTQQVSHYQQGLIQAIANVETAPLPMAYRKFLARCQTKACLVIPVLEENQQQDHLWGLLSAPSSLNKPCPLKPCSSALPTKSAIA